MIWRLVTFLLLAVFDAARIRRLVDRMRRVLVAMTADTREKS